MSTSLAYDPETGKPRPTHEERGAVIDSEMEALFADALEGRIPRSRELHSWEPARLNERHLAMITARVSGFQQRQIARAFGATDSNVSIVLNHPDSVYILGKLLARKASAAPSSIEERLQALSEPAVSALEDLLTSDDPETVKLALRKERSAFKVLDMNGHGQRKPREVEHTHRFAPSEKAATLLSEALREAASLREVSVVEAMPSASEGRDSVAEEAKGTALVPFQASSLDADVAPSVSSPSSSPLEASS